jgi:hypothetical protein
MINANCKCPNVGCKRHGDCVACKENHKGKTYCNSPRWKQKIVEFFNKKG